jgi:hypothetical protein
MVMYWRWHCRFCECGVWRVVEGVGGLGGASVWVGGGGDDEAVDARALSRNCATARCGDSVIPEPGLSRGALSQLDPWMLNGARGSLLELPPSLLQTPPPFLDR